MSRDSKRILRNSILLLLATVAVVCMHLRFSATIRKFDYLSGWALLVAILFLAGYNLRKRFTFLPLGSSETWLQWHIYVGYFTFALFAVHLEYRVPTGWFEIIFSIIFAIVMLSGMAGLFLSRQIPKRLTVLGGEVIFERVPTYRQQILDRAEKIAVGASAETQSATLLDFYTKNLRDFLAARPVFWRNVLGNGRGLFRVLQQVEDLKRYTNEREREILSELAALLRDKRRLEFHYSLQGLLKAWLFIHIPFTYSLLLFTLVHLILVFGFSTGAP
ncbi:MAG TPA: hypothetical protein VF773_20585 [Verrucomicrobiae bacterium]